MGGVPVMSGDRAAGGGTEKGVLAASAYCTISVALTLLNKRVLSAYSFTYVNFLVFAQQACILAVLAAGHLAGIITLADRATTVACLKNRAFISVLVTFLLYVLSSLHGLRFVSVPLFTVLRKTGVASTLIVEQFVLRKDSLPSGGELAGVAVIVVGALISGYGDLEYDWKGYAVCLFCNLSTSAHLVALSKHRADTEMDSPNLLFQCAICAVPLFLLISIASGELGEAVHFIRGADSGFLTCFYLSVLMAGGLNIATTVNTRLNSPTTQSVCASLKDVMLVFVSQIVEPVILSAEVVLGIVITFVGAAVHTFSGPIGSGLQKQMRRNLIVGSVGVAAVLFAVYGFFFSASVLAGPYESRAGVVTTSFAPRGQAPVPRAGALVRDRRHTRGKGDVLVSYDSQNILDSPDGDFIFYTFMFNKVLEAGGNVDAVQHFHGRNCYWRPDMLDREERQTPMDPHWCRIHAIWQLLDEGYDRVMYVDTDILLVGDFTFDKFMREAEVLTDFMPFQNRTTHAAKGAAERSLHGICIKEGGIVYVTSGLLLFHNTDTSYKILKAWLSKYPESDAKNTTANDQGPLMEILKEFPDDVSLTCSRSFWKHYFNRFGPVLRRTAIRKNIAERFSESLQSEPLHSPYAHLLKSQQALHVARNAL